MTEVRLLVVAHGPTRPASDLVLGDRGALLGPPGPAPARTTTWFTGPEPACGQTAQAWTDQATVLPGLADADLGSWSGRALADVAAEDPAGLQTWLTDVGARPHGGESLAGALARTTAVLAGAWPSGRSVVVVTPGVARSLAVAALGAPAAVLLHLDVGHGGRVLLSGLGSRWRLLELVRHPTASAAG